MSGRHERAGRDQRRLQLHREACGARKIGRRIRKQLARAVDAERPLGQRKPDRALPADPADGAVAQSEGAGTAPADAIDLSAVDEKIVQRHRQAPVAAGGYVIQQVRAVEGDIERLSVAAQQRRYEMQRGHVNKLKIRAGEAVEAVVVFQQEVKRIVHRSKRGGTDIVDEAARVGINVVLI